MSVRVAFEVSCPTINCEEVRLVGSLPALGSWDPFAGVPLTTTDSQYPVWRTAEILMPTGQGVPEVVHYKYVKIFGGSAVQWEVGPNRLLQPAALSEGVNFIEDVMYDIDEILARRNSGVRIHFQETLEKMPSKSPSASRLTSSVASPLRTTSQGQTPVGEKSPLGSVQELDHILRELQELEPTYRLGDAGKAQIQRAIVAVRSAIEAEHAVKARSARRCRSSALAAGSLLLVPLLPLVVAAALIWRYPDAQRWRWEALRGVSAQWRSSWSWTCATADEAPYLRGIRRGRQAARASLPHLAQRDQGRSANFAYPR